MRFEKNELTGDNPLNYKKMKNLFLRQSYLDSWEDYENSLRKPSFIKWDYICLLYTSFQHWVYLEWKGMGETARL